MKSFATSVLCLFFIVSAIRTSAQDIPVREPDMNKPRLFQQLPQRLDINQNTLETILQYEEGRSVNVPFAPNLSIQGVVSSVANMNNINKSVVIRSTNLPGAGFTLSKVTREDGTTYFTGRIISYQHGDAYEIVYENGSYFFNKKGFYDLINE